MRVLHVGKFFPPCPGGIERFSAVLLEALSAEGVSQAALVHATPSAPRERRDWTDAASGARMHEVPCSGRLLFVPVSPGWPLAFERLLRDFAPQLLHVHLPNPYAFWLLASSAARRIPWVLHWHADVAADARHLGVRLASHPYRLMESLLLRRAAAVVATSAAYRDASPALQAVAGKVRVVPLAVAPLADGPSAPLQWPAQGLRLLAVGRLSYYKGFDVLLDALAQVPACQLLLVGDGEQRGALEAQALRLGIAGRVRFAGALDDEALHQAYRDCDLFCLPSIDRSEAFGLVLLEAMRASRPILASAIPGSGVSEVAPDGDVALLVPPRDVVAFAAALRRLQGDADLRARLGQAGHDRWQARFRPAPVARALRALYAEVLADRGGAVAAPG